MSNPPHLVSVVIAVFNGRRDIVETLQCAFAQDYPTIEVIVVDGASTDGTQDEIAPLRGRLAAFVSEKDRGIGDAWNKGLALCKGEYVAILNCGDRWATDFVSCHMRTLAGCYDIIQYGTTYMSKDGRITERVERAFDPNCLVDGVGFLHTSVMTTRAVYAKVGPFDVTKRIAVDTDWMLRAARLGIQFRKVDAYNFMAEGGISSRQWLRGQMEYLQSLKAQGFVSSLDRRLVLRRRLQSVYLKFGVHRLRARMRMRVPLAAVALLNGMQRVIPLHGPRRLLWLACGVTLHRGATVHRGVRLLALRRLAIGEGTVINSGTFIDNRCDVDIGRHVSIGHDSRIYTTDHDYNSPDFGIRSRPVRIEDYAVVFAGACVMPGVTIGRGAVVLPFSVVTGDVDAMSVVGGVPAVVRGQRKIEPRYRMQYDHWFDYRFAG